MKIKLTAILLPLLLIGCGKKTSKDSISSLKTSDVVYGTDDRKDLEDEFNSIIRERALSTATQIPANKFKISNNEVSYDNKLLKEQTIGAGGAKLCSDEKFADQTAIGRCSGFLIAPNLILTAGHCLQGQNDCANNKWVFDYQWDEGLGKIHPLKASNIYSCKKVVAQKVEGQGLDYAIVELDRNVEDRAPLSFRTSDKISDSVDLTVIGSPTGLPTKITSNGKVRNNEMPLFFSTTLDTFHGNSGSAVLDSDTGLVEGILVRGDTDYVKDQERGCMVVNYCDEGLCRGEDVVRTAAIPNLKEIVDLYTNPLAETDSSSPFIPTLVDAPSEDLLDGPIFHHEDNIGLQLRDNATTVYTFKVEKDQLIKKIRIGLKLSHTYMSDLIIYLRSPDGTYATIFDREMTEEQNLDRIFDDNTGDENGLSGLVGRYSAGTWQMYIKDMNRGDTGVLNQVILKIE